MKRTELLNVLEAVKPGIAKTEMVPQTTSFAFINDRVVTYNDEISISCPIEDFAIRGAIPADLLYKFLTRLTQEELTIKKISKNEIGIKSGRARAGIALQRKVKLPLDELAQQSVWKSVPKKLVEGLRFTSFSCSRDATLPKLTCICIRQDGCLISTDRQRATVYRLGRSLPVSTFLMPLICVNSLLNYNLKKIARGNGWASFNTSFNAINDVIFSSRIFEIEEPEPGEEETFAKIERVVRDVKGVEIVLPTLLGEVLDRAGVFAKEEHSFAETAILTLTKNKLTVSSHMEMGRFGEHLDIKYNGRPLSFNINPVFLKEIARKTRKCIVGERMIKFAGEDWEHIMTVSPAEKG